MENEFIIDNEIKKMMIKYPNWEVPDSDGMYCFSINQVKFMLQEVRKDMIKDVGKMIDDLVIIRTCRNTFCISCLRTIQTLEHLKQSLQKLGNKK
jgi:hypothetical protein